MDQRHDVRAVDARRAGAGEDVAVTGRVDHQAPEDGLAARFRFHHDAAYRAALDDRAREPGMKAQLHARFEHHLLRDLLPSFGIERAGIDDGLGPLSAVQLFEAPAHPAVPHLGIVAEAVVLRRRHTRADALEAIDDLE